MDYAFLRARRKHGILQFGKYLYKILQHVLLLHQWHSCIPLCSGTDALQTLQSMALQRAVSTWITRCTECGVKLIGDANMLQRASF